MTSAAAIAPVSRQAFEVGARGSAPARKPAANRSPAPVVSTTRSTGAAAISARSPFSTAIAPVRAARDHQRADLRSTARRCSRRDRRSRSGAAPRPHCRTAYRPMPRLDHAQHALAAVADAQAFRQGEGDRAAGRMRDSRRLQHRRARPLRAPQIAFEEGDRSRADQLRIERLRTSARGLRPGQVFIVRCASGVTRIRQRPGRRRRRRAAASRTARRASACRARKCRQAGRRRPARRRPRRSPSAAAPAMLFAADPPLISRAGPIAA